MCALLLAYPGTLHAHEVRPVIVDFVPKEDGTYSLNIVMNVESWLAGISSEHSDTSDSPFAKQYEQLRQLPTEQLSQMLDQRADALRRELVLEFDGQPQSPDYVFANVPETGDVALARDSIVSFKGKIPEGAKTLKWRFVSGDSVFRMPASGGREKVALFVQAGKTSDPIDPNAGIETSALGQFLSYIVVGFDHIIPKGLDHILFVVGLYLLSTRWTSLLWQVTAFTVAHTITLGLAMAGKISLPASVVEPLIAASIVYIAVENLMTDQLSRWRTLVVFGFGLLHGLGFAGVLQEFGLEGGSFIAGLVGFNIGVELGQLAVIAICYVAFGLWFGSRTWYHSRVTVPLSILIAAIGAFWFYERVFLA